MPIDIDPGRVLGSLCASGRTRLDVLLPCCLTTYVKRAIVSASLSCCALKCFRIDVAREPGDCDPRIVALGSLWLRLCGMVFGSSFSSSCCCCCCVSSGVSREVLEALSAGLERESWFEGCEVGEGGASTVSKFVEESSLVVSLSLPL